MTIGYWHQVMSSGLAVPVDRPLSDLTAELTAMLGSPDPELRDGLAYPALATWISRGTYDFLLSGLGDGIAAGLQYRLGEVDTDSVFRRSYSALVLGECIARDGIVSLVGKDKVLQWGDRLASWFLREQDVRGWVPESGWAHALAHGADTLSRLAQSRHLEIPELSVILDVIADRLVDSDTPLLLSGEPDRLAVTVVTVLRRNQIPLSMVEPWLVRVAVAADPHARRREGDPYRGTHNAAAFLRSLYLHLELTTPAPEIRSDALLTLVDLLRRTNPFTLGVPGSAS